MICCLCLSALTHEEIQFVVRHGSQPRLCGRCQGDILILPEPQKRLFKDLLARILEKADA